MPALLANAAAIDAGADEVQTEIDGKPWVQKPFPYQARCLQWLRQAYVGLEGEDRSLVDEPARRHGVRGVVHVRP